MNFKEKYQKEIDSLQFSQDFGKVLTERTLYASEREDNRIIMKKRSPIRILVAVISIILLLSLSVFAITAFLSAGEVAEELGESQLSDKWQKSDSFPYASGNEEYTVSVLGIATDEETEALQEFGAEKGRSYVIASLQRTDGTPLSSEEKQKIQFTPLIEGCEPWRINLWTLGSGALGYEKDGVQYYLFETENLEIFADRTVYLAAYEGFTPSADIFKMNSDGTIAYNESYTGFKAIFELPFDPSKADPIKAEELLSQL